MEEDVPESPDGHGTEVEGRHERQWIHVTCKVPETELVEGIEREEHDREEEHHPSGPIPLSS